MKVIIEDIILVIQLQNLIFTKYSLITKKNGLEYIHTGILKHHSCIVVLSNVSFHAPIVFQYLISGITFYFKVQVIESKLYKII